MVGVVIALERDHMNLSEQEPRPEPEYRTIPLTRGRVAFIDESDYPSIAHMRWTLSSNGYAISTIRVSRTRRKCVCMHRYLLGDSSVCIDHIDGNRLNNRRYNLRFCSQRQNQYNVGLRADNQSGYRGVSKFGRMWKASIRTERGHKYLGLFATAELASAAYVDAASALHGEFARLAAKPQMEKK